MNRGNSQRSPIRVILVSRVLLYREGLAQLLAGDDRLEVVATFARGAEAVSGVARLQPNCVVLDMVGLEAGDSALAIRSSCPDIKIVAIGVSERQVIACAESGISGFVLRSGSTEALVRAIEAAMVGKLLCSEQVAAALLRRVGGLAALHEPNPDVRLTPRELEVVALIDRGQTNKEIASRLVIEVATVKNHVHNLLEKLGVRTRGEAAARVRAWRGRRGVSFDEPAAGPHPRA